MEPDSCRLAFGEMRIIIGLGLKSPPAGDLGHAACRAIVVSGNGLFRNGGHFWKVPACRARKPMPSSGAKPRLAHLWQLPLLLLSLGLFGTAAYLFINPGPGLTIDQKIQVARVYLNYNRPEAALDQLNKVLTTEKLTSDKEGKIHVMMAESLERAQAQHHISLATNHASIIEQTRLAMGNGIKPDVDMYRRLGDSYDATGDTVKALESYRRAMALDPRRLPNIQSKVIELQLAQADTAPAEASIDEYLKEPKLADGERAWGLRQKGRLLTSRGSYLEAKPIFDESRKLSRDPGSQGESNALGRVRDVEDGGGS